MKWFKIIHAKMKNPKDKNVKAVSTLVGFITFLRGESHNDFHTQCIIMT